MHTLHVSPLHPAAVLDVDEPWLPFSTVRARAALALPALRTIVGRTGMVWELRDWGWVQAGSLEEPLPSPFFLKEKRRKAWTELQLEGADMFGGF